MTRLFVTLYSITRTNSLRFNFILNRVKYVIASRLWHFESVDSVFFFLNEVRYFIRIKSQTWNFKLGNYIMSSKFPLFILLLLSVSASLLPPTPFRPQNINVLIVNMIFRRFRSIIAYFIEVSIASILDESSRCVVRKSFKFCHRWLLTVCSGMRFQTFFSGFPVSVEFSYQLDGSSVRWIRKQTTQQ